MSQPVTQDKKPKTQHVSLLGPDGNPISLDDYDIPEGSKNPFEDSKAEEVSKFLAKHGPALSKLFLIFGSAAGTVYNAIKAGQHPGVEVPGLIIAVLIGCGLVIEFCFAYAWSKKGSYDLAGQMRDTADEIFKIAAVVMIGDLSLSVAEVSFGIGEIAKYWVGLVQPVAAVYLIVLLYRLKGEHPEYLADLKILDIKTRMKAEEAENVAQALQLLLDTSAHSRLIERRKLEIETGEELKQVESRAFQRQARDRAEQKILGKQIAAGKGWKRLLPFNRN